MQYNDITTKDEILAAFKACQNPGEKLDLFKSLATCAEPPTELFKDLLTTNKNSQILALAIQAFSQLDNDSKSGWDESPDLIEELSNMKSENICYISSGGKWA